MPQQSCGSALQYKLAPHLAPQLLQRRWEIGMDIRNFLPACRLVIPVICHPAINVKQGFGVIFPTLPFVDFDFADAELLVNLPSQLRQKDASTVADDRLRNPEMCENLVENGQVGSEILGAKESTGQDLTAVVIPNRDRVDRSLVVMTLMALDIAHIDAPIWVASVSSKGHSFFALWDRFPYSIEFAVECQNAPTGTGTHLNAHRFECRVDTEFAQLRIFLKLLHLGHNRQRHLLPCEGRMGLVG